MKNTKTKLLSSAAGLAAVGAAVNPAAAADLPLKNPALDPPPPAPVPTWQGFYVGGSLGASWLSSASDDTGAQPFNYGGRGPAGFYTKSETGGSRTTTSGLGWLGALQAGYNFQDRNFVYGVEADFAWLASTKSSFNGQHVLNYTLNYYSGGTFSNNTIAPTTRTSQVNELALFRARFGFDFNGTLPYLTAGLALGDVKNSYKDSLYSAAHPNDGAFAVSSSTWTPGVVLGGGLEHQFNQHWSLRAEILWVGFKDQTLTGTAPGGYAASVHFSNSLTLGQIGVNYKF